MNILGAGLAGLIAGNIFPTAKLFEKGSAEQLTHKAVLRFRSSAVGDATGIQFRAVRVHKGLWHEGKAVLPSVDLANAYSMKVIGKLADRSIWSLEPADRFVAPENFVEQLAERCAGRIEWNCNVDEPVMLSAQAPLISTAPMTALLHLNSSPTVPHFKFAQIAVRRFRVPDADVFQTIYFPSPETTLYRATITGSLLVAEYINKADDYDFFPAFFLSKSGVEPIDSSSQRFGKIAPIDNAWRKNFIFQLSQQHNIFSLGRFATWRNILLDDVLKDCYVIKRLLQSSSYEARLHSSK